MKQVAGKIYPFEKPELLIEILESMNLGEQFFYMTPTQEFSYTTTFVVLRKERIGWSLWRQKRSEFGGRDYLPIFFKTAKEVIRWMIENNAYLDEMELMFKNSLF
ncbi:MAG: hypothetical protein QXL78_02945 [Methanocellales archaeon]